ncbi:MAG: UDP-glucose 4-epimerase GalE [Cyclobacteriaceae bacterium]|nr:UDP-glucose 4-epimerase GalE [Cyclobacteriaceae bacterium]
MKKILVTGGAGYIGSHTVVELVNAGYTPVIIDNFSNSEPFVLSRLENIVGKKISFYEGDVCDHVFLAQVFKKEKDIFGAIHFAAFKAVGESVEKPVAYYRNNIESTMTLLETMQQFDCTNLVFSSSCTVYGQADKLPVTENTPRKEAESPYGNTKKICEDIIRDFIHSGSGLKAVSLRYFNPIGAHPSSQIGELPLGVPANLVPFITQTAAGIRDSLKVFGNDYNTPDGTCIRDYIHVTDLAKAHVKSIEYLENTGGDKAYDTFNVGVGKGHTVLEVIKAFEKGTGVKLNYDIVGRRAGDVEKIYADTTKATNLLHWQAEKTLEEALKDAWGWQLSLEKKL